MFMKVFYRLIPGLVLSASCLTAVQTGEAARVVCNVSSSDEEHQTSHSPEQNPLQMSALDFSNGFRFSAIFQEAPAKFKSYVYYESKDRFVLISKQESLIETSHCGHSLGQVQSHAPYLENHLAHECTYQCPQ